MTFADYMREVYPGPFVLESSSQSITVRTPTDMQVCRLDSASGTVTQLRVLCGDSFDDVWQLCRDESMAVCSALTSDIADAFGLGHDPGPNGWAGLVSLLNAHGPKIEFDLRCELGIDLHDYVRGNRPWSQLYRFLPLLPRHSHFYASIMDDEKSVSELLATTKPDDDEPSAFGYAGWTYERELLTTVCDLLQQFHASFIQANSDKGTRPTVDPMPRPATALDRVRARQVIENHHNLVALMRPRPSQ